MQEGVMKDVARKPWRELQKEKYSSEPEEVKEKREYFESLKGRKIGLDRKKVDLSTKLHKFASHRDYQLECLEDEMARRTQEIEHDFEVATTPVENDLKSVDLEMTEVDIQLKEVESVVGYHDDRKRVVSIVCDNHGKKTNLLPYSQGSVEEIALAIEISGKDEDAVLEAIARLSKYSTQAKLNELKLYNFEL